MNKPSPITLPQVLAAIQAQLDLSRQTERELLEEIEGHLEDALAAAAANGEDETEALMRVVERFGLKEVGRALQEVHAPWESTDAIIACALPVVAALVLRWLIFAPDGSAIGWQEILIRPAFWIVALTALLAPLLRFQRWPYALVSWGFFWTITIIFITWPVSRQW